MIALHAWLLQWLGDALVSPQFLKPMAVPMFTRLLQPEAPPAEPKPSIVKRAKKRKAIVAAQSPAAQPASHPASAAETTAPAQAPQVSASTPDVITSTVAPPAVAAASAPASAASSSANASLDSWPIDTRLNYRLTGWYDGDLTG